MVTNGGYILTLIFYLVALQSIFHAFSFFPPLLKNLVYCFNTTINSYHLNANLYYWGLEFVCTSSNILWLVAALPKNYLIYYFSVHRFSRKTQRPSRTMAYGSVTRVELVITTCTKSTVIPRWTVLLNKCIPRWLLVIEFATIAFKSSRQPQSQLSFARGRAPSSSIIQRSSSPWCSGKWGHQPGSSKLHTRLLDLTCLCKHVGHLLEGRISYSLQFFYFNIERKESLPHALDGYFQFDY